MKPTTVRVRVTGRVQGVGFRGWAAARARSRGLSGWVQNRDDGSVIGVLSGDQDDVLAMTQELWSGPGAASVTDVQMHEIAPDPALSGFEIRR